MKRGSFMLKKERDKLYRLVKTYLCINGADADATSFYEYTILTKAGTMRASFGKDTGAIFCRFDDPPAAVLVIKDYTSRSRLNHYSGKWNWHFERCTADQAFQQFKSEFDKVL